MKNTSYECWKALYLKAYPDATDVKHTSFDIIIELIKALDETVNTQIISSEYSALHELCYLLSGDATIRSSRYDYLLNLLKYYDADAKASTEYDCLVKLVDYIEFIIYYTVQYYDYEGGTLLKKEIVREGESVEPPTPTYEHYTFLGWSDTSENVHEDKVIYGNWTAVLIINPTTSGTLVRRIASDKYNLQYSRDLNNWSDWLYNNSITINANNPLYIRGHYLSGQSTKWFTTNFDFTVSGTLRGMSYNADFTSYNTNASFSIGSRCLNYVFRECEGLKSAVDLEIPYIKNGGWAYGMFYNCTNLEEVVVTSLTKASTASTSNDFGYFLYGCKNLKRLTIQQSGAGATNGWLGGGTNDTATIVLPSNHPLINEPRGTSAIPYGWTIETF